MQRCPDCNAVLTKTERVCGACGTRIKRHDAHSGRAKLALLANVAFYLSLAFTAATLFVPGLPSLSSCLPVCVILLMIRSTADQMVDNSR